MPREASEGLRVKTGQNFAIHKYNRVKLIASLTSAHDVQVLFTSYVIALGWVFCLQGEDIAT